MNHGFVKVATAIPHVKVANSRYNTRQIEGLIAQAEGHGVAIISFPELSITSYSCQDLFNNQLILDEVENAMLKLMDFTRELEIIAIIGLPIRFRGMIFNCAAVLQRGKILGIVPKTFLPNYKEFNEKRWFTSGDSFQQTTIQICGQTVPFGTDMIFKTPECTFGIEICEDLWAPIPPSSLLSINGAEIIFNLCADNDGIGKHTYLKNLIAQQSARNLGGYVLTSCGFGESSQDVVFGGKGFIYENGSLLAESECFSFEEQLIINEIDVERLRKERQDNTTFSSSYRLYGNSHITQVETEYTYHPEEMTAFTRTISPKPFVPNDASLPEHCKEVINIQVAGLAKRILHTKAKTVVIGISGGLDSTLALLVCVDTFDKLGLNRKSIVGITMPGFGTTDRTYTNATNLMKSLGITIREINIKDACIQHFQDIDHDYINNHDVTYENSQARERTQILMDAANQLDGFVLGTGDLSELALGWATYNGDHMSMYGINASVPKTLIRHLVGWMANQERFQAEKLTLLDIVDTPISPELIPTGNDEDDMQRTEDLVGPYELHDFFLFYFLRYEFKPAKIFFLAQMAFKNSPYTDKDIKHWLKVFFRRFFSQQFKRSCLPDGPKVGSCSLSPRGDWRMVSDVCADIWLEECDEL